MKKVVVSRLFNVLCDSEDAIATSTMLKIDKIRQDGNIFIIMDNCHYKDVLFYDLSYPFIDYIIACNGSYIYDVKKNKVVYKKKILTSTLKKLNKTPSKKLYYLDDEVVNKCNIENDEVYKIDIIDYTEEDLDIIKKLTVNYFIHDNIIEINRMTKFEALDKILKNKYSKNNIISICLDDSDIGILNNSNGHLIKQGENDKKIVEKILNKYF